MPPPPTPNYTCITEYEGLACIKSWGWPQLIDVWIPCLAGVVTENTGDPTRIAWIDEKDDLWMSNLELATPHLVVELAKIKVHNHDEGFAREPVRLLMRRVMTFALNNDKLALAKDQLRIRGNNGRTHLDISACQPMTLFVAQAKELLEGVNSELLAQDDFHETPS